MIYLDHAATTEPYPGLVVDETALFANPSSTHSAGRGVRARVDQARRSIAEKLECEPAEVIFTSGATEAMHLAVVGSYLAQKKERGVVYTSPLVHSCVWSALDFLEKHFGAEIKKIPVNKTGFLDLDSLTDDQIGEAALFITEYGNSEIGNIQPVAKLGKKIEKWVTENKKPKPALIVDGAAAIVTEKIALDYQKCDFITLSSGKFGGLKGTGLLLHRQGVELAPLQGGSHEWGYRGGTENVTGILALSQALEKHREDQLTQRDQYLAFQAFVRDFFGAQLPDCIITTPKTDFLPHVFHFRLPTENAALFVARADQAGLAISAGSACSSGTTTASKVLLGLGLDEAEAGRGVRLSFGRTTTEKELKQALEIIKTLTETA